MTIDITTADDSDTWNRHVEQSPHGTPLHRWEALSVLATHTGSDVHTLVGYKGQEPVGVLPVFEIQKSVVTTAFSPPPNLHLPYLGPGLLNFRKLTGRKAERRHRRFVDGCVEWIDAELHPRYVHLRTTPGYDDVRPLQWNDFAVRQSHTYVVDLSDDADELLESFSSDARSNVRSGEDIDYEVAEGDADTIERILERVRQRYDAQDRSYRLPPAVARDLYEELPEGAVRPYVCEVSDEFASGVLALDDGHRVYRWQGGAKPDVELPVNDLLDWGIMRDASERGRREYDLVGADTPRLNGYKAKFDPELRSFYQVERGGHLTRMLARLYQRTR